MDVPCSTEYTHAVYCADDLYCVREEPGGGERKCVALNRIPAQTVLLMEHLLAFPVSTMQSAAETVLKDPQLGTHLCPRRVDTQAVDAQIKHNCFYVPARRAGTGWYPDMAVLGLRSSMFNHDAPPNAHCDFMPALMGSDDPDSQTVAVWISVVFTLNEISQGEEICINYGGGHVGVTLTETDPLMSREEIKALVDNGIACLADAGLVENTLLAFTALVEYMSSSGFEDRVQRLLPLLRLSDEDDCDGVWEFLFDYFSTHLNTPEAMFKFLIKPSVSLSQYPQPTHPFCS